MPPQRKLQAEDVLEQVLNDTDSDMSASSSDSESEASEDADEAVDVPHRLEIMFLVFGHKFNKHHKMSAMGQHRMLEITLFCTIMT